MGGGDSTPGNGIAVFLKISFKKASESCPPEGVP